MWIKASTRKPDTTRHVFVRGRIKTSKFEKEATGIAAWLDFDNRWQTIHLNQQLDTAGFPDIEYWCEISDLLAIPFEEVSLNKGLIPLGCSVIEMLDWAMESTLEDIAYAESNIKWLEAQNIETDEAARWHSQSTKRYQRLYTAWERRTNESI